MKDFKTQQKMIFRNVEESIARDELEMRIQESLQSQTPLIIKAGFDPSAPDLHLGHSVLIRKMKDFQDAGHQIVLIVGDFTARIGDPSGRSLLRPALTEEEVLSHARTYAEQAFCILDQDKTQVLYNSQWMKKMDFSQVLSLTSRYTVARMLEREDFKKRFDEHRPISLVEFMYPLMQGYDSVHIQSDVELGGTDQKFNLLMGRYLQREYGQPQCQSVLMMPLLEGLDGYKKMSKSYGNAIGLQEEPYSMFAKIMSISDELMLRYYRLLTDHSLDEIEDLKKNIEKGEAHPKKVKENLAFLIVSEYHSQEQAQSSLLQFNSVVVQSCLPEEISSFDGALQWGHLEKVLIIDVLVEVGFFSSKGEAKRMIQQGGVRHNQEKVMSKEDFVFCSGEHIFQVGKRKFIRVIF